MSGACAPTVSAYIRRGCRRLTCFNGDAVAEDAFECGSACQPETAYTRSSFPLKHAPVLVEVAVVRSRSFGGPRPRVCCFRLGIRTASNALAATASPLKHVRRRHPRRICAETVGAHAPPVSRLYRGLPAPLAPPLTWDRKSFQRILHSAPARRRRCATRAGVRQLSDRLDEAVIMRPSVGAGASQARRKTP